MKSVCSRYLSVNYVINIISCFISVLFYFFILHIFYIDTLAVWYYSDLRSDLRKLIVQTHFTSTFHNCSFIQKSSWLLAFSINNGLCCPSPLAHDSGMQFVDRGAFLLLSPCIEWAQLQSCEPRPVKTEPKRRLVAEII